MSPSLASSLGIANLANTHGRGVPAHPNLVVQARDSHTTLVARLELRALARARDAPAHESERGLQPGLPLFTHGQLIYVAYAQLLARRDVARRPERDLPQTPVPVVIHVRLAGRVEARAEEEDPRALRRVPRAGVVVPARERVRLEDRERRGLPASPGVREGEVLALVRVGEGGERGEDRRVRTGSDLGKKRGLDENELSWSDGARCDDTFSLSGDVLHGKWCCWVLAGWVGCRI